MSDDRTLEDLLFERARTPGSPVRRLLSKPIARFGIALLLLGWVVLQVRLILATDTLAQMAPQDLLLRGLIVVLLTAELAALIIVAFRKGAAASPNVLLTGWRQKAGLADNHNPHLS